MVLMIMSAVVGTFIDSYKETISTQAVLERKDQVKTCLKAFDLLSTSVEVVVGSGAEMKMEHLQVVSREDLSSLANIIDPTLTKYQLRILLDYCCDVSGDVDLEEKLGEWERFYNFHRPHGAHNGKTPYEALREKL